MEGIEIVTSASIDKKCRLLMTQVPQNEPEQAKNVELIINPNPEEGMLSSFRRGLRQLKSIESNVMLCLTDYPLVKLETYKKLKANAKNNKIIIPKYNGRRGHPVIFGADFIPELLEKVCPEGARTIVRAHPEAVVEINVDDPGILIDIDTPEDAKRAGINI